MKKSTAGKRKGDKVRSITVSVRLDPKLRYLAELASRQQRRTLSSYIEWVVLESFSKVELAPKTTLASKAEELWDVDPLARLVRLGYDYAHLLEYDEQVLWKIIRNEEDLWQHEDQVDPQNFHLPARGQISMAKLHERWPDLLKTASTENSTDVLPRFSDNNKARPNQKK